METRKARFWESAETHGARALPFNDLGLARLLAHPGAAVGRAACVLKWAWRNLAPPPAQCTHCPPLPAPRPTPNYPTGLPLVYSTAYYDGSGGTTPPKEIKWCDKD